MNEDLTSTAHKKIDVLKQSFTSNRFAFDIKVQQHLSRDKELRKEVVRILTGQVLPYNKCTTYNIADLLSASFSQYSLF